MSPERRRRAVRHLQGRFRVSERRACRLGETEKAAERALAHADAAGDPNERAGIVDLLCTVLLYGPAPADAPVLPGAMSTGKPEPRR